MELVLYCPEIPGNLGTLLRLSACWGISVAVIEPMGFVLSHGRFRRSSMDYDFQRHLHLFSSWGAYIERPHLKSFPDMAAGGWRQKSATGMAEEAPLRRNILLSPSASTNYMDFAFQATDSLVAGCESAGFPKHLEQDIDYAVAIPMISGQRSINLALSCAMVLSHALHQTHEWIAS